MLRVNEDGSVEHTNPMTPAYTQVPHKREVLDALANLERLDKSGVLRWELDVIRRWVTAERANA